MNLADLARYRGRTVHSNRQSSAETLSRPCGRHKIGQFTFVTQVVHR